MYNNHFYRKSLVQHAQLVFPFFKVSEMSENTRRLFLWHYKSGEIVLFIASQISHIPFFNASGISENAFLGRPKKPEISLQR